MLLSIPLHADITYVEHLRCDPHRILILLNIAESVSLKMAATGEWRFV